MTEFNNDTYRALQRFISALGFSPNEVRFLRVDMDDQVIEVEGRKFPPRNWGHATASSTVTTVDFAYNDKEPPF